MAIIVMVVVIILVAATIGFLLPKKEHFGFTTFEGTTITTLHYPSGVQTLTAHNEWNTSYQFQVSVPMMFWVKLYNYMNGTMSLTGVTSEVVGFIFTNSTPAVPVSLPLASSQDGGVRIDLWFDTPSANYNGPFLYTLHLDWYPPALVQNTITSVKENQVIKTHTSTGTTTQTYEIDHPDLAGKYRAGAPMSIGEFYRYNGTGTENITSIEANTTGFSFAGSLPALPVVIPNASQPMLAISMVFNSPATVYNGTFTYTVHIDRYPDQSPRFNNLTTVREIQYVTSHFGSATNTVKYVRWHNETAGHYPVGKTMNITEPYWNLASGNLSITSMVCNTTGFSLLGTVPLLPVHVPNSPDPSAGNVTLVISFAVPATQYIGPFEYIVYFDEYLI